MIISHSKNTPVAILKASVVAELFVTHAQNEGWLTFSPLENNTIRADVKFLKRSPLAISIEDINKTCYKKHRCSLPLAYARPGTVGSSEMYHALFYEYGITLKILGYKDRTDNVVFLLERADSALNSSSYEETLVVMDYTRYIASELQPEEIPKQEIVTLRSLVALLAKVLDSQLPNSTNVDLFDMADDETKDLIVKIAYIASTLLVNSDGTLCLSNAAYLEYHDCLEGRISIHNNNTSTYGAIVTPKGNIYF